MQLFGLVSLLIMVALVSWWFTHGGPVSAPSQNEQSQYESAINQAEEAADLMSN